MRDGTETRNSLYSFGSENNNTNLADTFTLCILHWEFLLFNRQTSDQDIQMLLLRIFCERQSL